MVRAVEKSDYVLTRLDVDILDFISNGESKNMGEIAKKVNSTTTAIKNNLRKLEHYKLINWKRNDTPKEENKHLNTS